MTSTGISNNSSLVRLLYSSYLPKILNSAIDIDLFRTLSEKSLPLPELSERLGTEQSLTKALLEVLLAIDLIEIKDQNYGLSQDGRDFFLKESMADLTATARDFSGSAGPFDTLTEILQKGAPEFDNTMWCNRETMEKMERQQNGGGIQAVVAFVKEAEEFASCKKMCDFAGSSGYFAFAFMEENPGLQAEVYDLPQVCALARELKSREENYHRISYRDFDVATDLLPKDGYDFFFSSHFLYQFNAENTLASFLKKVNQTMVPGGLFVSNHIAPAKKGEKNLTLAIVQLITRVCGYPTHKLPEEDLKAALQQAGFGDFETKLIEDEMPYPTLLLRATKKEEVG